MSFADTPTARVADRAFHSQLVGEVLSSLKTSREGLSACKAQSRLAQHGPNALRRARRETTLQLLWRQR